MSRRDANDKEWQAVKERVRARDKEDRILKVISPAEFYLLRKNARQYLYILDPAHFKAVSERPDLCYKSYNIILLNRYSHDNIDHFRDPITAEPITKEQQTAWWVRLLKGDPAQYSYLKSKEII